MRTKGLIQPLVGAEKIIVRDIFTEAETNAIVIVARHPKREQCRCGICGRKAKYYDRARKTRRWRCNDLGSAQVYVEAQLPRVSCKKHSIVTSAVPWARHRSRFCKSFEETVAWLSVHASKTVVSELMRIEWHTVGDLCGRVYKELEATAASRFDGLVNIGIDETSYKKGYKYMTVVVNHDTASVVWCSKGYGKEVLSLFFEQLSPEQRASIRCVSADGARWIASCVEEYCPNAERCVDPFHVVSWATEALDKVRRQAWAEAHETAQSAPKRGRGRPTKEEEATPQKRLAKGIKNLRYSLLKNPEHLSENQQAQLDFLMIMIQRKPPSRHSMTLFIKMIRALHSLLIGFSIIISQIMHCRLSYIPFAQAWQKHPPCASFYAHHLAEGTAYSNQFRRFSHSIRAINCANPSYSLSLTSPHVLRKYLYFSFEPGVGESVPVTAAQF